MSKCNDCGSELQMTVPPQSEYVYGKIIKMPFGIKITIYRDKPEYGCTECIVEHSNDKQRQVYDAGFNDGVTRVLEGSGL